MRRYMPLLALITLCSVVSAYVYRCEPGTEPTVCQIWNLQYDEATVTKHPDRLPNVNISSAVRTVQLRYERAYYARYHLESYDLTLHATVLRNPSVVMIHETRLHHLVLPTNLQVGDFTDNILSVVETYPNKTYDVLYLDLSDNSLDDVANLTVLVRLQTLNLDNNRIKTLEPNTFTRMENLTHLYLGQNRIYSFEFNTLPKALTVLWLPRNQQKELKLVGYVLPALKELDLASNVLSTVDIAALFTAFPALEVVLVSHNPFQKHEAKRILTELKRRNVSYYIGVKRDHDMECDYDEYIVEEVCFTESDVIASTVWKGIVLIVLAVLVYAMFRRFNSSRMPSSSLRFSGFRPIEKSRSFGTVSTSALMSSVINEPANVLDLKFEVAVQVQIPQGVRLIDGYMQMFDDIVGKVRILQIWRDVHG
uniref:Leucine rich immune protein (Coil-less) n=1 Tax=Anopheles culicifacies TaxID=139723 RepID=A0A182MFS3_9DIPT